MRYLQMFDFFFPIKIPLMFFLCLIIPARDLRTIMERSGVSEHPCLLSNSSKIASKFSPLWMSMAVCFLHTAFIILRYVPASSTLQEVCYESILDFVKSFFSAPIDRIM